MKMDYMLLSIIMERRFQLTSKCGSQDFIVGGDNNDK